MAGDNKEVKMVNTAIFLDRDGTLIEEPEDEVVDSIQKVLVLPNTIPALKLLVKNEFKLFIITNQIGISQGRLTIRQFHDINNHLFRQLEKEGIRIGKTFFCPHGPNDNCNCRKPKPGMLEEAKRMYGFNLKEAWIIGDRQTDIQLGKTVGCKTILVQTGRGLLRKEGAEKPDFTAKDLLDAVKYILNKNSLT